MLDTHARDACDDALFADIVEMGIRAKLPALAVDEQEASTGMIFEVRPYRGACAGALLCARRSAAWPGNLLGHAVLFVRGLAAGADGVSEVARHDGLIHRLLPTTCRNPPRLSPRSCSV